MTAVGYAARLREVFAEYVRCYSERRCIICDWPLAHNVEAGCVPDNCSYRAMEGTAEHERIWRRRVLVTEARALLAEEAPDPLTTEQRVLVEAIRACHRQYVSGGVDRDVGHLTFDMGRVLAILDAVAPRPQDAGTPEL